MQGDQHSYIVQSLFQIFAKAGSDFACLREITVGQVDDACMELMKEQSLTTPNPSLAKEGS